MWNGVRVRRVYMGGSKLGTLLKVNSILPNVSGSAFSSVADHHRWLERHVPTSKICSLLLLNLLQICYRSASATFYDLFECQSGQKSEGSAKLKSMQPWFSQPCIKMTYPIAFNNFTTNSLDAQVVCHCMLFWVMGAARRRERAKHPA